MSFKIIKKTTSSLNFASFLPKLLFFAVFVDRFVQPETGTPMTFDFGVGPGNYQVGGEWLVPRVSSSETLAKLLYWNKNQVQKFCTPLFKAAENGLDGF